MKHKLSQLPLLALLLGGAFQACGGLNSVEIEIVPDESEAGSGGSTSTQAGQGPDQAGSTGSGEGGSSGSSTTPNGGAPGAECEDGAACDVEAQPGLCDNGFCVACEDGDDDDDCVDTYGDGYLCIEGACLYADCRSDDDCAEAGGGACINNKCEVCRADGECLEPDTICDVTTGVCVSNAACGNTPAGGVCPVNPQDLCCDAGGICTAVACCGTDPCPITPGSGVNDGQCSAGQCVRPSCSDPVATTRYVDFDADNGGSGSKTCPFNNIKAAFDSLAATGGTVVLKAGTRTVLDATLAMGSGINLVGADANFEPCTKETCEPASYPVIETGNRRALNLTTAGNRALRFLRFVGLPDEMKRDAEFSGIFVSEARLTIDHVEISGYRSGLVAEGFGAIEIGPGMNVHHNRNGLSVNPGGSAAMAVPPQADASHFDFNDYGITVVTGSLTLAAPPTNRSAAGLVTVNDNAGAGLFLSSSNDGNDIAGLEAARNGGDEALPQSAGAVIFTHSTVKIRDSYFHDNLGSGVHIQANGSNTATGLSKINLGTNPTSGAGKNTFIANVDAGICVDNYAAQAATDGSLPLAGNYFRTSGGDCVAGGTYTRARVCEGGVDYSGGCHGAPDMSNCSPASFCN